ncbi:hypothetical protein DFH06DRAFT_370168 [Mycena polygramma]|nr:hypothetical protein DFH06DRAFT_370168 [Mycena polygramma]
MSEPGCIPTNPDISGIGVRAAIYIQNLLSFIPAIWAIWDGNVSTYELESVETQSTTILLTAFAILISAMVQARTTGISNFHAAVVLSLSWMNNTNTFIYFLLYVKYKSQPGPEYIEPTLSAWMRNALGKVLPRRVETTAEHHRSMDAVQRPSTAGTQIEPVRIELEANMSTAVARIPRPTRTQRRRECGTIIRETRHVPRLSPPLHDGSAWYMALESSCFFRNGEFLCL